VKLLRIWLFLVALIPRGLMTATPSMPLKLLGHIPHDQVFDEFAHKSTHDSLIHLIIGSLNQMHR